MGLLDTITEAYMRNVGNPARQLVGGGLRGLLGLDPGDYADGLGMEAYRNAQALSMAPTPLAFAALPAAVVKGAKASKAVKAAPRDEALETARKNGVKMLGLPENNTAMDRAKALGFEDKWAHGSPRNDLTYLQSSRTGAQGPGAYATNYLPEASTYSQSAEGATVYPLMVKRSEALVTKHNNPYDELGAGADDELLSALFGRGKSAMVTTQERTPEWLLRAGAPDMPERQHFVSVRPENFRSRFAAFDPARVNENDLLGAADPTLLAILAAGTAAPLGYGLLTSNKDAKK